MGASILGWLLAEHSRPYVFDFQVVSPLASDLAARVFPHLVVLSLFLSARLESKETYKKTQHLIEQEILSWLKN